MAGVAHSPKVLVFQWSAATAQWVPKAERNPCTITAQQRYVETYGATTFLIARNSTTGQVIIDAPGFSPLGDFQQLQDPSFCQLTTSSGDRGEELFGFKFQSASEAELFIDQAKHPRPMPPASAPTGAGPTGHVSSPEQPSPGRPMNQSGKVTTHLLPTRGEHQDTISKTQPSLPVQTFMEEPRFFATVGRQNNHPGNCGREDRYSSDVSEVTLPRHHQEHHPDHHQADHGMASLRLDGMPEEQLTSSTENTIGGATAGQQSAPALDQTAASTAVRDNTVHDVQSSAAAGQRQLSIEEQDGIELCQRLELAINTGNVDIGTITLQDLIALRLKITCHLQTMPCTSASNESGRTTTRHTQGRQDHTAVAMDTAGTPGNVVATAKRWSQPPDHAGLGAASQMSADHSHAEELPIRRDMEDLSLGGLGMGEDPHGPQRPGQMRHGAMQSSGGYPASHSLAGHGQHQQDYRDAKVKLRASQQQQQQHAASPQDDQSYHHAAPQHPQDQQHHRQQHFRQDQPGGIAARHPNGNPHASRRDENPYQHRQMQDNQLQQQQQQQHAQPHDSRQYRPQLEQRHQQQQHLLHNAQQYPNAAGQIRQHPREYAGAGDDPQYQQYHGQYAGTSATGAGGAAAGTGNGDHQPLANHGQRQQHQHQQVAYGGQGLPGAAAGRNARPAPTAREHAVQRQQHGQGVDLAAAQQQQHLLQEAAARKEAARKKAEEVIGWSCPTCTLVNPPTRPGCSACSEPRPENYKPPDDYQMTEDERQIQTMAKHSEEQYKKAEEEERKRQLEEKHHNYMALLQTDEVGLVVNHEPFDCSICFVEAEAGEGAILRECLHTVCKECLRQHIKISEDADVKCPCVVDDVKCDASITEREIRELLGESIHQWWGRGIRVAEQQADNSYHCKTPDCIGWCMYEDDVETFKCDVCRHENCLMCKAIHKPMNCKEYQEDLKIKAANDEAAQATQQMLENLVRQNEAMHCPKCDVIVQKASGCDWMRCLMCKTELCWATKGPRWGPNGNGDTSGGCGCRANGGRKCTPTCGNCH